MTLGIDPPTISTWMRDPSLLAAYNAAQRDIYDNWIRKLRRLQERALDVLEQALRCDDLKLAATVALQVTRINVAMGQPTDR